MKLVFLDYAVILFYFLIVIGIGVYYSKRASKSMEDFYLSGRNLSWWVAGTSIAATGFAADTPFMVTELVRQNGIAGNWFLWCFAGANLSATFLFVRFWRRAKILTELEIIEERYEGKSAAVLRGFQSIFYGIAFSALCIGFITVAMQSFITVLLDINKYVALIILLVLTMVYAVSAGLWGVVANEVVQFVIAFFGSVFLTVIAVTKIGGLGGIQEKLVSVWGQATTDGFLSFFPTPDVAKPFADSAGGELTWGLFFIYILVLWWCGEKADGSGVFIQRVMATKNEKHAFFAGAWFNVVYYGFLMWPWILIALISLADFPTLTDHKLAYPMMIQKYLPPGAVGIMFAAFLAAFMSSVDGLINWGSSYMVNDFYKRFIKKDASQKHYIWVGRGAMVIVLAAGLVVWHFTTSLAGAWKFMAELFSGLGLIWLMRWFWWRINAWSEITAYILSIIGTILINVLEMKGILVLQEGFRYLTICAFSTIGWVTVTYLTNPVSDAKLKLFVEKVNPGGKGWRHITQMVQDDENLPPGLPISFSVIALALGSFSLFTMVFGVGSIFFANYVRATILISISIILGYVIFRLEMYRHGIEKQHIAEQNAEHNAV